MSDKTNKPEWWPENPYLEDAMVTITSDADYAKAIPDPTLRTAVAWYLSNRAWQLASDTILDAMNDQIEITGKDGGPIYYSPKGAYDPVVWTESEE